MIRTLPSLRRVVAQVHGERTEKLQFNFPPAEFAATAMKRFGEFTKAQAEQLSNFQETNRQWILNAEAVDGNNGDAMDKMIARLNISHYKIRLVTEQDEAKRQILLRLLAEEQAKLAALDDPQRKKRREN